MSLTLPTVTGYSRFWQETGDRVPYAMISQAQNGGRSKFDNQIARIFKRNQYRDVVAAFLALIGAAAGGTATSTFKQRHAQAVTPVGVGSFGAGNIQIDTITAINRATTAADVTFLKKFFNDKLLEAGLNLSTGMTARGSGGGGKIVGNVGGF